jgi:lipid A ethanolaminephosphotransferase
MPSADPNRPAPLVGGAAHAPHDFSLATLLGWLRHGGRLLLVPRRPLRASSDALAVAAGLFAALVCNGPFFAAALAGRSGAATATWVFALALLAMLASLHVFLFALVLHRRVARPLLAGVLIATALATYYMGRYGLYLDPTMLRNVLRTDWAEARPMLGWALLPHLLLYAGLPMALLAQVQVSARPLLRATVRRALLLAGAAAVFVLALLLVFQDFASLMRNQRELRYLATPANLVYSLGRALTADSQLAALPRSVVGGDAHLSPAALQRAKPALLVLVVGETARAANWGLNGYARQTTPELAALPGIVNFADVTACGTNTETSLPCMFSAVGRRNYDEQRIRGSESLLHVLARAGVAVSWHDNQSGCKGVCAGLPTQQLGPAALPVEARAALCNGDHCLDEVLLQAIDAALQGHEQKGPHVLVLHMLGNHGPAYHRRYPAAFRRHTPACESDDLHRCSREQIVNAYDNALLYTDHVLARAVRLLQAQAQHIDGGLVYVSDHGESLGEHGLYLHGLPYAMAPSEQTRVPMVWWLSSGLARGAGLDPACLAGQARRSWTHDNLFHSTLGLLGVETSVYEPALDIGAPCRQ